jgi:Heterokaryon incompatibility protein (HET)
LALKEEMQSNSPYVALSTERHEIRLLRFLGAFAVSDLSVHSELEIVSLDDPLLYDALSYQWGPMPQLDMIQVPITVNGVAFSATTNLQLALVFLNRHLAQTPSIRVWIDAICINQQDEIERGQQVDLMRRIYSSARVVWCWLTPSFKAENASEAAMRLINEAGLHLDTRVARNQQNRPLVSNSWISAQAQTPAMGSAWVGPAVMRLINEAALNLDTHVAWTQQNRQLSNNLLEAQAQIPAMESDWNGLSAILSAMAQTPAMGSACNGPAAMRLINEAALHLDTHVARNQQNRPLVSETWLEAQAQNPAMESAWNGLSWLLTQPYWRRNWIVQEIV